MSVDSVSDSVSESEECCFPTTCACEDWLTLFCDYVPLTVEFCGETTEFAFARFKNVPMEIVDPRRGVFAEDRQFEISMLENAIDVGPGMVVTDAEGTEWQIYRTEVINAFCLRRLWGRSVAACFSLLDTIEILEQDCECEDCGTEDRWNVIKRVRGEIVAERGSIQQRNDSRDIAYTYSGNLERWPLKKLPGASHRLRNKLGTFWVRSVTDGGKFVPFSLVLEPEHADCSVRG